VRGRGYHIRAATGAGAGANPEETRGGKKAHTASYSPPARRYRRGRRVVLHSSSRAKSKQSSNIMLRHAMALGSRLNGESFPAFTFHLGHLPSRVACGRRGMVGRPAGIGLGTAASPRLSRISRTWEGNAQRRTLLTVCVGRATDQARPWHQGRCPQACPSCPNIGTCGGRHPALRVWRGTHRPKRKKNDTQTFFMKTPRVNDLGLLT